MFTGQAEEAMTFYVTLFPGSKISSLTKYGPAGPGTPGSVLRADFEIAGHPIVCIDSPPVHAFTFTPSMSLFVDCESHAEIDSAFTKLADGGKVLMPLDNYGFSEKFGWVQDRFGVSWQLNLA